KNLTTTLFLMLTLSACSSGAQLVRKDAAGGRVALQGAYMPAMADARMLMTEHCDGRYAMTERDGAVEFRCAGQGAAVQAPTLVVQRDAARKF
ncbi:MAG: hypothetical protein ACHQ53_08965, partial [Polyangiales bacterium]